MSNTSTPALSGCRSSLRKVRVTLPAAMKVTLGQMAAALAPAAKVRSAPPVIIAPLEATSRVTFCPGRAATRPPAPSASSTLRGPSGVIRRTWKAGGSLRRRMGRTGRAGLTMASRPTADASIVTFSHWSYSRSSKRTTPAAAVRVRVPLSWPLPDARASVTVVALSAAST